MNDNYILSIFPWKKRREIIYVHQFSIAMEMIEYFLYQVWI